MFSLDTLIAIDHNIELEIHSQAKGISHSMHTNKMIIKLYLSSPIKHHACFAAENGESISPLAIIVSTKHIKKTSPSPIRYHRCFAVDKELNHLFAA